MKNERRLIIVVRADPVICGHAGEARNLAEAAVKEGFTDVRILTWQLSAVRDAGLPLKPEASLLPYSPGIIVERPEAVGDYRVIDGGLTTAMKGRLIELLSDGKETIVISMYLLPHTNIVTEAVSAAQLAGLSINVTTVAEAVGSDVTNAVRSCIDAGRFGPAIYLFSMYLAQDLCLAVSRYTKKLIVDAARQVDAACGTNFEQACAERVSVSYPAIDTEAFLQLNERRSAAFLERRGLREDGYVLFLSRLSLAKGVIDLVQGYRRSACYRRFPLVLAGDGPARRELEALIAGDASIQLLTDVNDEEKKALMRGAAAYVLPSKPRPEFTETFGIALAEKMLVGGLGPVLTTDTGGIPEAVGSCGFRMQAGDVESIAATLDRAVLQTSVSDKVELARRARDHALRFDRRRILTELLFRIDRLKEERSLLNRSRLSAFGALGPAAA